MIYYIRFSASIYDCIISFHIVPGAPQSTLPVFFISLRLRIPTQKTASQTILKHGVRFEVSGYRTLPSAFSGQMRKTTFPTICSFATQPIDLLRESIETSRWSPITKIRDSGTWYGRMRSHSPIDLPETYGSSISVLFT